MRGPARVNAQAPNVSNVIRAHRYELINSKGNVEAILLPLSDTSKNGLPGVAVCDAQGDPGMMLHVDKDGPMLAVASVCMA